LPQNKNYFEIKPYVLVTETNDERHGKKTQNNAGILASGRWKF